MSCPLTARWVPAAKCLWCRALQWLCVTWRTGAARGTLRQGPAEALPPLTPWFGLSTVLGSGSVRSQT